MEINSFKIKLGFFFTLFFIVFVYGQENKTKNIIILNNDKVSMGFSRIEIDGVRLHPGFNNFIIKPCLLDSIEITVPSSVLLCFTLKKKKFRFAVTKKDNYFLYKSPSLFNRLYLKKVEEEDWVQLEKKQYIQKMMKEFKLAR